MFTPWREPHYLLSRRFCQQCQSKYFQKGEFFLPKIETSDRKILDTITDNPIPVSYEGWNFNSGNYLFTNDTK